MKLPLLSGVLVGLLVIQSVTCITVLEKDGPGEDYFEDQMDNRERDNFPNRMDEMDNGERDNFPDLRIEDEINHGERDNFPDLRIEDEINHGDRDNFPNRREEMDNGERDNFPDLTIDNEINHRERDNFPDPKIEGESDLGKRDNFPDLRVEDEMNYNGIEGVEAYHIKDEDLRDRVDQEEERDFLTRTDAMMEDNKMMHKNTKVEQILNNDEVQMKMKEVEENLDHFFEKGLQIADDDINKVNEASLNRFLSNEEVSRSAQMQFNVKRGTLESRRLSCEGTGLLETSKLVAKSLNLPAEETVVALRNIAVPSRMCDQKPSRCEASVEPVSTVRQACDPSVKYRTIDGKCNNLDNPTWGSTNTIFRRLGPSTYEDGVDAPKATGVDGSPLPNCRVVSAAIKGLGTTSLSSSLTQMVKQWGQFLDHDTVLTPEEDAPDADGDGNPEHLECCDGGVPGAHDDTTGKCLPIDVSDDEYYKSQSKTCLRFLRSKPAPAASREGGECRMGIREQFNGITGFIDASNVYGSDSKKEMALRSKINGRLKTSTNKESNFCIYCSSANLQLLPETGKNDDLFIAGDVRVNEQPALTSIHTVWMRYHNIVADKLYKQHSNWDDETLFQEARKIISASIQHITYNEFLPKVLDAKTINDYNLAPGSGYVTYNKSMDPSHFNEFAAAAFRFGHTLIGSKVQAGTRTKKLCNHFFDNRFLKRSGQSPSEVMQGECDLPGEKIDMIMVEALTDHLFAPSCLRAGNDLMALNCMRGRDHGLPSFNDMRESCGLPRYSWPSLSSAIPAQAAILKNVYKHPDDIDLFLGGLAESHASGALLGPTFSCILGKTFQRLKFGDRFFYENGPNLSTGFTEKQLKAIRNTKWASVLCHATSMGTYPEKPMSLISSGSELCSQHIRYSITYRIPYYW